MINHQEYQIKKKKTAQRFTALETIEKHVYKLGKFYTFFSRIF